MSWLKRGSGRSNMARTRFWTTLVVLAHTALSAVHGTAHVQLGVPVFPTAFHFGVIVGVMTLAPLGVMALLLAAYSRTSLTLLLISMAGGLSFGLYYHYLAPGPDHCSQIPAGPWGVVFHVTACLLAAVELLGCVIAARGLVASPMRASARPRRIS